MYYIHERIIVNTTESYTKIYGATNAIADSES